LVRGEDIAGASLAWRSGLVGVLLAGSLSGTNAPHNSLAMISQ